MLRRAEFHYSQFKSNIFYSKKNLSQMKDIFAFEETHFLSFFFGTWYSMFYKKKGKTIFVNSI